MAVTPPTPPTPPTAPKVPAVTLNDGGSVTDSTVPVSGYQSAADAAENQAKQAVARGDGSLTKTTQEKPAAKADSKTQLAKADADNKINQSDDKAAPLAASENDAADNTGTLVQQPEPMAGYNHTTIYWLFTVISILFLVIVVWQLIKRKLTSKAVDAIYSLKVKGSIPYPRRAVKHSLTRIQTFFIQCIIISESFDKNVE